MWSHANVKFVLSKVWSKITNNCSYTPRPHPLAPISVCIWYTIYMHFQETVLSLLKNNKNVSRIAQCMPGLTPDSYEINRALPSKSTHLVHYLYIAEQIIPYFSERNKMCGVWVCLMNAWEPCLECEKNKQGYVHAVAECGLHLIVIFLHPSSVYALP